MLYKPHSAFQEITIRDSPDALSVTKVTFCRPECMRNMEQFCCVTSQLATLYITILKAWRECCGAAPTRTRKCQRRRKSAACRANTCRCLIIRSFSHVHHPIRIIARLVCTSHTQLLPNSLIVLSDVFKIPFVLLKKIQKQFDKESFFFFTEIKGVFDGRNRMIMNPVEVIHS